MITTTYRMVGFIQQADPKMSRGTAFDLDIVTSDTGTVFRVMSLDESGEFTEVQEAGTTLETLLAIVQAAKATEQH